MTSIDYSGTSAPDPDSPARRPAAPAVPRRGRLRPLGLHDVTITGGFWGSRQDVNAGATLGHILYWLERAGWLPNFDLAAAGTLPEGRRGREFSDSEVYKFLEAAAWELGRRPDPGLESRFRSVVARVAAAQEPDGYLNTRFGREGQAARWSDLEWGHELYCTGHLIQAAVARERTSPGDDDGLWATALRAADLVVATFGDGGIESVCGHAEIETALVELARESGDERYTEQARLFVERRGTGVLADIEWGRAYFQDDVTTREADVLRGHAVRANYLASGAADVAAELGDAALGDALVRQWANTRAKRTYVTGGQGSHHQDEAFGDDYELPSDRAYSETCAGVASIQFSWRLLLDRSGVEYADLIERTLYNVVATSPSHEGTEFYYANTLHQRRAGIAGNADELSPRASSSLRSPWFEVSCCPTNVARTMASLAAYIATVDDSGLQLHQFAPATIRTRLADGSPVELAVDAAYPADGEITIRVVSAPDDAWTLSLRVPEWAGEASLTDGATTTVRPGYATVRRVFRAGDVVRLSLPMAPRITQPDPRIDAVRGSVAVERGPEVFALESVDLPTRLAEAGLDEVRLSPGTLPRDRDTDVVVDLALRDDPRTSAEVALVRYHDWAGRGPSTMRVWIPTN